MPFAFQTLVDRDWVHGIRRFLRAGISRRSAPRDINVAIGGTAPPGVEGLEAVALRRPWLVRVAVGMSCVALVAESAPPSYTYTFQGPPVQTTTALDADVTTRVYRITFQAQGLGPENVRTTLGAAADVTGSIERNGLSPDVTSPSVDFTIVRSETSDGGTATPTTSVFTSLQSSATLTFEGDCEKFEAAPCEAVLWASFSRSDDGAAGGALSIDWTLTPRASVSKKDKPDAGPFELPWTVSVEEQ